MNKPVNLGKKMIFDLWCDFETDESCYPNPKGALLHETLPDDHEFGGYLVWTTDEESLRTYWLPGISKSTMSVLMNGEIVTYDYHSEKITFENKYGETEKDIIVHKKLGLQGEILRLIDVDTLIEALSYPQEFRTWKGEFYLFSDEDEYVFRSPDFRWEKIDYGEDWTTNYNISKR